MHLILTLSNKFKIIIINFISVSIRNIYTHPLNTKIDFIIIFKNTSTQVMLNMRKYVEQFRFN